MHIAVRQAHSFIFFSKAGDGVQAPPGLCVHLLFPASFTAFRELSPLALRAVKAKAGDKSEMEDVDSRSLLLRNAEECTQWAQAFTNMHREGDKQQLLLQQALSHVFLIIKKLLFLTELPRASLVQPTPCTLRLLISVSKQ